MLPLILQQEAHRVLAQLEQTDTSLIADYSTQIVCAMSRFASDIFLQHPEWLADLQRSAPDAMEHTHYADWLKKQMVDIDDESHLMSVLRRFRQQILSRIAWAQSLQLYDTTLIMQQLSQLADTLLIVAADWLYQQQCQELGTPTNEQGVAQPFVMIAMGKLGGQELNFSSDVDLIFAYPELGVTRGVRHELTNQQFFTRLGQRLIKVLNQRNELGIVYRVDMRLRPFGDSGALVLSFAALEDYYQEQGRDWERYAMVKARIMGEPPAVYKQWLLRLLQPFTYRRYLDFSVIQSLRNMKSMIVREVKRRQLIDNIKLSAGGIREIEFIIQSFQLIRGGQEPLLQQPNLLKALATLAQFELLTLTEAEQLTAHYLFLRRLENVLQAITDQQNQTLPKAKLDQIRLAYGMGYSSWSALKCRIDHVMLEVHHHFNQIIGQEEESSHYHLDEYYKSLWLDQLDTDEMRTLLHHIGSHDPDALLLLIHHFKQEIAKRSIGQRGRTVLDQLMPLLLHTAFNAFYAETVLHRLFPLLLNIVTRTTYLELLLENQPALMRLFNLANTSPMIVNQLTQYPYLLDELIYPATLYQPLALSDYISELNQSLLRLSNDNEEAYLEQLRQFKQAHLLRIAVADINGILPVMAVSDHLTYLAQAIISVVIEQAWHQITKRYGKPTHLTTDKGFIVIAYGKLGGIELGYNSDLDLVFLHNCPETILTDGPKPIPGRQFYLRLVQRVIHLFTARTAMGVLYEIDARLRPSGESGLLVSTLNAFSDYQQKEAWVWEHQALIRARAIYGDEMLQAEFRTIRREIVCSVRSDNWLKHQINTMRKKMYPPPMQRANQRFDLKKGKGGITDIEFIAQYLVLRYANCYPMLAQWSDNIRIFQQAVSEGIMHAHEANHLINSYIAMREALHHLMLQQQAASVKNDDFIKQRQQVIESWQHWLGEGQEA